MRRRVEVQRAFAPPRILIARRLLMVGWVATAVVWLAALTSTRWVPDDGLGAGVVVDSIFGIGLAGACLVLAAGAAVGIRALVQEPGARSAGTSCW